MFVLLYITRPRGITSTIAIAIGPRHVYNVVYKAAKNKIVGQKTISVAHRKLSTYRYIVFKHANMCTDWLSLSLILAVLFSFANRHIILALIWLLLR